MLVQLHCQGTLRRSQSGVVPYRTLVAFGLLVAVVVGLLLWYVPPMEKDNFSDLTEPTRTAARACGVELKLSREQTANFVSQIKDGKFSIGSELKQISGPSGYQGCLDRRLGVKTSSEQNEVTAAQVIERAKAYEELFHEYKVVRDQLDKERSGQVVAKADELHKQLQETKLAISSSSYKVTDGLFSAGLSMSQSTTSASDATNISAVSPEAFAAWNQCVETSLTASSSSGSCNEILAFAVKTQLIAAVGLGRFADSVYYLREPIDWRPNSRSSKYKPVHVPTGFVVDFASVPRVLWTLTRPDGGIALAGVVHDYLYWAQSGTRAEADEIFKVVLQEFIQDEISVNILYQGVRIGGQAAWDTNTKLKAYGVQRVLKRFPDNPQIKWADWQTRPNVFSK